MKILVGWDGSEQCSQGIDFLAAILSPAAEVTLCHILPKPEYDPGFVSKETMDKFAELRASLGKEADEKMTSVAGSLSDKGFRCEIRTEGGAPAQKMTELSEGFDLVVVGARGLNPLTGLLLGSVSESLVRHGKCPVLIWRGRQPASQGNNGRHIVLGYDGMEASEKAASFILQWCEGNMARLSLISARKKNFYFGVSYTETSFESWPEDSALLLKSMKQLKSTVNSRYPDCQVIMETPDNVVDIADALIRYASENHGDLIVAGSTNKSIFEKVLLGSVSSRLALHSQVPLLIVK